MGRGKPAVEGDVVVAGAERREDGQHIGVFELDVVALFLENRLPEDRDRFALGPAVEHTDREVLVASAAGVIAGRGGAGREREESGCSDGGCHLEILLHAGVILFCPQCCAGDVDLSVMRMVLHDSRVPLAREN